MSKRRAFRTLGLRMRNFGRSLINTYIPPESRETPTPPAPSWKQNAETPLEWGDTATPEATNTETYAEADSNDYAETDFADADYANFAPQPRPQLEPVQRRAPQQPQRQQPPSPPRQRQPQPPADAQHPPQPPTQAPPPQANPSAQPVRHTRQQMDDDAKLENIMAFHRRRDAERENVRQQRREQISAADEALLANPENIKPGTLRRRRSSVDYVETTALNKQRDPIPGQTNEMVSRGSEPPEASDEPPEPEQAQHQAATDANIQREETTSTPPSQPTVQADLQRAQTATPETFADEPPATPTNTQADLQREPTPSNDPPPAQRAAEQPTPSQPSPTMATDEASTTPSFSDADTNADFGADDRPQTRASDESAPNTTPGIQRNPAADAPNAPTPYAGDVDTDVNTTANNTTIDEGDTYAADSSYSQDYSADIHAASETDSQNYTVEDAPFTDIADAPSSAPQVSRTDAESSPLQRHTDAPRADAAPTPEAPAAFATEPPQVSPATPNIINHAEATTSDDTFTPESYNDDIETPQYSAKYPVSDETSAPPPDTPPANTSAPTQREPDTPPTPQSTAADAIQSEAIQREAELDSGNTSGNNTTPSTAPPVNYSAENQPSIEPTPGNTVSGTDTSFADAPENIQRQVDDFATDTPDAIQRDTNDFSTDFDDNVQRQADAFADVDDDVDDSENAAINPAYAADTTYEDAQAYSIADNTYAVADDDNDTNPNYAEDATQADNTYADDTAYNGTPPSVENTYADDTAYNDTYAAPSDQPSNPPSAQRTPDTSDTFASAPTDAAFGDTTFAENQSDSGAIIQRDAPLPPTPSTPSNSQRSIAASTWSTDHDSYVDDPTMYQQAGGDVRATQPMRPVRLAYTDPGTSVDSPAEGHIQRRTDYDYGSETNRMDATDAPSTPGYTYGRAEYRPSERVRRSADYTMQDTASNQQSDDSQRAPDAPSAPPQPGQYSADASYGEDHGTDDYSSYGDDAEPPAEPPMDVFQALVAAGAVKPPPQPPQDINPPSVDTVDTMDTPPAQPPSTTNSQHDSQANPQNRTSQPPDETSQGLWSEPDYYADSTEATDRCAHQAEQVQARGAGENHAPADTGITDDLPGGNPVYGDYGDYEEYVPEQGSVDSDMLQMLGLPPDTPVVRRKPQSSDADTPPNTDMAAPNTDPTPSTYSPPSPSQSPPPSTTYSASPNTVQRQPFAESDSGTVEESADTDADDSEGEQANVDKLARDVYQVLRNRLRIERERRNR